MGDGLKRHHDHRSVEVPNKRKKNKEKLLVALMAQFQIIQNITEEFMPLAHGQSWTHNHSVLTRKRTYRNQR